MEVSRKFQESFRNIIGCFKDVSNGVLRKLQGSFQEVSRKFQGRSRKFQASFKQVSSKVQECFKQVSRTFPGFFK